ncbi:MAG: hypothetical protein HYV20_07575 [Gemmatimonadetes bacterium]|nr:hypothetical protein [Gemmatimonadota bacterium]
MSLHVCWRTATSLALAVGLLGLAGCALTFDAGTLGANVTVAAPPDRAERTAEFRRSQKAVYLLWGLVTASRPSLERTLAGQVTGSQSVANLRIRVRSRFSDLLITGLTAGLVAPRSVTFEGCILNQ